MKLKRINILLFIFLVLNSCSFIDSPKKEIVKTYNYMILLDLSDRLIDNTYNQSDYDKKIILHLLNIFHKRNLNLLKDNELNTFTEIAKDNFQVIIAEQKNSKVDKYNYENLLKCDFSTIKQQEYKFVFKKEFIEKFTNDLNSLYTNAVYSSKKEDYFGADIWKFFEEDLQKYIRNDSNTENYLFVITDGYIAFENYDNRCTKKNRYSSMEFLNQLRSPDWKEIFDKQDFGLYPLDKKYPNLNVMVLEITPHDYFNENELLDKIWKKWFNEMGITNIDLLKHQSVDFVKKKIDEFLKIDSRSSNVLSEEKTQVSKTINTTVQENDFKEGFYGVLNGKKIIMTIRKKSKKNNTITIVYDLISDFSLVASNKKCSIDLSLNTFDFTIDKSCPLEFSLGKGKIKKTINGKVCFSCEAVNCNLIQI